MSIPLRVSSISRWTMAAVASLILLASSGPPAGAEKQYGYNSRAGNGMGAKLTFRDFHRVSVVIRAISTMTFTIKGGVTYDGLDIAIDLIRMQLDGRMGRGVGAHPSNKAAVSMDGLASTAGDRMNIADHFLDSATKAEMVSVLAHEWLHTTQTSPSMAVREAPAYQVSKATYLLAGGRATDPLFAVAARQEAHFKRVLTPPAPGLFDGNASTDGALHIVSDFRRQYYLFQTPGLFYLSKDDAAIDSIEANPDEVYFDALSFPLSGGLERLILFGSDRSDSLNPVGTVTIIDADSNGFLARRDSTLMNLKYPFSAVRDSLTGKFYVLDAHFGGPGIVVLEDTNGDFVPDAQLPAPFAPRGFALVDSALGLQWAEHPVHGPGLALATLDIRGADSVFPGDSIRLLVDSNGDDVADMAPPIAEAELLEWAPTFTRVPNHDDMSVELYGIGGHPVVIRSTDDTGDADFGTLGGGVMSDAGKSRQFALNRPLVFGEYIIGVDGMNNWRSAVPMQVGVGTVGVGDRNDLAPIGFAVSPNPGTTALLKFELARQDWVELVVYDAAGRRITVLAEGTFAPGQYTREWDGLDSSGSRVRSSVYFYRLKVGAAIRVLKGV